MPVYANEKIFAVHLKEGGKKKITLPKKYMEIIEIMSGKTVAKNTDSFEYEFQTPDTAIFETR